MHPYIALTASLVVASVASAENPLIISGAIDSTDLIAIGFDGPDAPNANTFYYDIVTVSIDTAGEYGFEMASQAETLAPWFAVYDVFSPADYTNPPPLFIVAGGAGTTVSDVFTLQPGTYQLVLSSIDWIEEPDPLDDGPYTFTMTGPEGASITIVPSPGMATIAGLIGLATLRRRRV